MSRQPKTPIEEALRVCQEVRHLDEAAASAGADRRALVLRRQAALARLREIVAPDHDPPGVLGLLRTRFGLEPNHVMVLVWLLFERVETGPAFLGGRALLQQLGHHGFDLLAASSALSHQGPLLGFELVRTQGLLTDTALEADFRIAEWVFQMVLREVQGAAAEGAAAEGVAGSEDVTGPYLSSAAHLLDMKRLVELYQMRAAGIFDDCCWRDRFPEADALAADVTPLILRARTAIMQRETAKNGVVLPIVALRREYSLQEEEEIIVLELLFHELFSGSPLLEASELVRLVSSSEEDVFRKQRLLAPGSCLRENGLVIIESEIEGKDLLGESHLPAWLEDRLLAGIDEHTAIDADECQSFHRYLQRLRDSDEFYRNL